MPQWLAQYLIKKEPSNNKSKLNDRVRLPTSFPRGTVVHYNGIPCELLDDTPYYSATIEAARECDEAHLPGDCPICGAT
jgi:hypothetical protein